MYSCLRSSKPHQEHILSSRSSWILNDTSWVANTMPMRKLHQKHIFSSQSSQTLSRAFLVANATPMGPQTLQIVSKAYFFFIIKLDLKHRYLIVSGASIFFLLYIFFAISLLSRNTHFLVFQQNCLRTSMAELNFKIELNNKKIKF